MPTVFLRDLCHCQRVTALRVKEVETATLPLLPFGISSQGFKRRTLTRILGRTDEDGSTMTKKSVEWFSSPVTAVWKCLMFWFRDPDSPAYCIWLLYCMSSTNASSLVISAAENQGSRAPAFAHFTVQYYIVARSLAIMENSLDLFYPHTCVSETIRYLYVVRRDIGYGLNCECNPEHQEHELQPQHVDLWNA